MPALVFLILLYSAFKENLRGPSVTWIQSIVHRCHSTWYYSLLGVHNYLQDKSCLSHTWYVAADLQLYALSPVLLFSLHWWRWRFVPVLVLLVGASIFVTLYVRLVLHSAERLIFTTHGRFGPWIVGLILGFVLYTTKAQEAKVATIRSKFFHVLGWISCIVAQRFVFYPSSANPHWYEASHRQVWAIFVAWTIFSCQRGFSSTLNRFLSAACFQFTSKLSYCVYLLHLPLRNIYISLTRFPLYYEPITRFYETMSLVLVSMAFAFVWSLLFELPWANLERSIVLPDKCVKLKSDSYFVAYSKLPTQEELSNGNDAFQLGGIQVSKFFWFNGINKPSLVFFCLFIIGRF